MGVGATIESSRRVLGRDITSQRLRVTTYEPEHAVSFVAEIPILRSAEVRLVFEPIEGGTRVTRTSELEPGPVLRFLLPVLLPLLNSVQNTEMADISSAGSKLSPDPPMGFFQRRRRREAFPTVSLLFQPLGLAGIIGAEAGGAPGVADG